MIADVIRLGQLFMGIYPEETNEAVRQLARGATFRMVDISLEQKGVGSGPRAEILDVASRIINRRARLKHVVIGAVGSVILVCSGYWYYLCVINRIRVVEFPTVMFVIGLLLTTYGIYNATQNEVESLNR